jgi:hypothetical protein
MGNYDYKAGMILTLKERMPFDKEKPRGAEGRISYICNLVSIRYFRMDAT